jgi:integrase
MVILAAYGGFRFGEITELRRGDVTKVFDKDKSFYVVSVSRAVTLVDGRFIIGKPKSPKSNRTIPISSALTNQLESYLETFVPVDPNSLLFPRTGKATHLDEHLRHDVLAKHWARALKRTTLQKEGLTFHSLRHYAGTQFHKAGATLPEVMNWLGDSSIESVKRYLHETGEASVIADKMPMPFGLQSVA